MAKLTQIEGIGVKFSQILQDAGIDDQEQLLAACAQRKGREKLATQTGISHKLILKWTNQADLARIHGIGEEYAELLERSGVDSVPELAQRNPDSLYEMLQKTNARLKLVRQTPAVSQISDWIEQAKSLPRAVFH
ncbi:MAG: DUF4332 domain-containing protein [Legionellaceae bacterium]|nr:DUF4332 domain-containing protein [Legionellaceae bacterium]